MKKPFFSTSERVDLLNSAAREWTGTPFAAQARIAHVGVDCVQLAGAILCACGHIGSFDAGGPYTMDGGLHLQRSMVIDWLDARGSLFERWDYKTAGMSSLAPGDLLVFRASREGVEHHVGIFLGGSGAMFVNALPKYGVRERTIRDATWQRLLRAVYRPVEEVP